jgi:hypothetical protein
MGTKGDYSVMDAVYGIGLDLDPTNPKDRIGIKKPSTWIIPDTALLHLGMAMRYGAEKYGPYNWREKKVKASIYLDAIERHRMAWASGETVAKDSKIHHLAHLMACAAILIDAEETGNLVDDRPKTSVVVELLERLCDRDVSET